MTRHEDKTANDQPHEPVLSRDASGVAHYRIRTVWDFLAVPEERLSECLREFAIMLEMARASVGLMDAVSDELLGDGRLRWRAQDFVWVDDDLRTATLNVRSTPSTAEPT